MKNYETFFEDLWDEVSPQLVSDDIWYKDKLKIQYSIMKKARFG